MESLFRMMVPVAMVLSLVILIEQVAPRHRVPLRERFFTIWDQLFGTAYFPAKDEWPDTGVEGVEMPQTFGGIRLHPYRQWRAVRTNAPDHQPVQEAV